MGIDLTLVDEADFVGWAAAKRIGEISMTSYKEMVDTVIAHLSAKNKWMVRLNLLEHGDSRPFKLGSYRVGSSNLAEHRTGLVRPRSEFSTSGTVHLQHCQIGQNKTLLLELAKFFDVPVFAGKDFRNPIYRLNSAAHRHEGWLSGWVEAIPDPFSGLERYVRADPDGTYDNEAGRP